MSAGHADAPHLSIAQLTAVFKATRRSQSLRDRRALMIAAAGTAGGEAFKVMLREIEKELAAVEGRGPRVEGEESGTPLNQEDFERMIKESEV
jgi:hypothetical protein